MPLTPVKTPEVVKSLFPNYIWNMDATEKVLYLTFDDGPTPEITEWVLNTLKQFNAKATFFCIGDNVKKHPEIFQKVINDGHSIGNHTQHHLKGWKTKKKDYLTDVELCEASLKSNHVKSKPKSTFDLFRPPYGKLTPKQGKLLQKQGYRIIMWDVLSFDWDTEALPENCYNNVISKATKGSIIVFHDSLKASKNMQYALPQVLNHFSKKGFVFKKLEF